MNFFLHIVGCQQNVADGQELGQHLINKWGWQPATDSRTAGVIIVVSCSVRQRVVDSLLAHLKKWRAAGKKIYLLGCVLPADKKRFGELVDGIYQSIDDFFKGSGGQIIFNSNPNRQLPIINYITITRGCDNFCSYCAVPLTRGRERSVPFDEVICQVKKALAGGAKEIILLGQNVNSYKGKRQKFPTFQNEDFIRLLQTIDSLPGKFTFNFLSSNPYDFSDQLIVALAKLKKWPRELHLPVQSGDNEILQRMNRKYTAGRYLALILNLKSKILNLKLSTDIIAGFPGETEEQFQHTVELCRKAGFSRAFIAQYSPRPGTAAARLTDDIPPAEKKRRWRVLEKVVNKSIVDAK